MSGYLLDTHVFLWFVAGDNRLPEKVRETIIDIKVPCFISAVSLWEITIKIQLKKLELKMPLHDLFEYIERNRIELIHIHFKHLLTLSNLPRYHSDPFDRLIVSQAISENLFLVTTDRVLDNYPIKGYWT